MKVPDLIDVGRHVRHLVFDQLWREFRERPGLRVAGLEMLQKTSDGLKTRPIELEDLTGLLIQPWAKLQKEMAKRRPGSAAYEGKPEKSLFCTKPTLCHPIISLDSNTQEPPIKKGPI